MKLDGQTLDVVGVLLTQTHHYSFRPGKPALVTNLKMVTPKGLEPRLAYEVLYPDGFIDYVCQADTGNYKLEAIG